MKQVRFDRMTVDQLVDDFVSLALAQYDTDLDGDVKRYNKLFREMRALESELKSRAGDQRTALIRLYDHPNPQVRLMSAKATLAVAPEQARRALEALAASKQYPQAGDAGMSLRNLDSGIFKPT